MGCIVNGPGEMADADFGYVGGSPGKIDLYVGKVTLHPFLILILRPLTALIKNQSKEERKKHLHSQITK